MFERILGWMVERAMPRYLDDYEQEKIAEEAAENAIRQTARLAAVAGVILLALIVVALYRYLPGEQVSQVPPIVTEAVRQPEMPATDDSTIRRASEELQKKLDGVTKERDALKGKVTGLEGQMAELNRKLQAAEKSQAPEKSQVAEKSSGPAEALRPAKQRKEPIGARVVASRRSTYECGDGQVVRDPLKCNPASAAPPGG
jgi:hypothetical protein